MFFVADAHSTTPMDHVPATVAPALVAAEKQAKVAEAVVKAHREVKARATVQGKTYGDAIVVTQASMRGRVGVGREYPAHPAHAPFHHAPPTGASLPLVPPVPWSPAPFVPTVPSFGIGAQVIMAPDAPAAPPAALVEGDLMQV